MKGWLSEWKDRFWALPMLCVVAAVAIGLGITRLDHVLDTQYELPFLFAGGPEGARAVLSAIITSMISFTGLVFSITIIALQLASSQFSPRILRTFLRDRVNQLTLGVFVATFSYAFSVLRGVRGTAQTSSFVPQVAVTVSFLFVALSVLVFLIYIHHMANSVRAATIITKVGSETRKLLDEVLPEEAPTPPPLVDAAGTSANWTPVLAARSGVIQQVDLAALASSADAGAVRIARAIGEFVPAGAVVLYVEGTDDPDATALLRAVHFGRERSMDEDPAFGIRQLVDMAERALSPGVNDPTTAVQALDQIHDLLRQIVRRPVPPYRCHVEDGRSVVLLPQPTVQDYLALGLDEIAHWSADSDRVRRRIAVLLDDVRGVARPEHRPAVEREIDRLGLRDMMTALAIPVPPSDTGLR